jgi:hypothetical protein
MPSLRSFPDPLGFGILRSRTGRRRNVPSLQCGPEIVQEPGHPDALLDLGDGQAVDARSACTGIARDPTERHDQRRRVGHEVVRSDHSAVPAFPLVRFCGPPPEPDVPVGRAVPALHKLREVACRSDRAPPRCGDRRTPVAVAGGACPRRVEQGHGAVGRPPAALAVAAAQWNVLVGRSGLWTVGEVGTFGGGRQGVGEVAEAGRSPRRAKGSTCGPGSLCSARGLATGSPDRRERLSTAAALRYGPNSIMSWRL